MGERDGDRPVTGDPQAPPGPPDGPGSGERPRSPLTHWFIRVGIAFLLVFLVLTALAGVWANTAVLLVLTATLGAVKVLVDRGHTRMAVGLFVGSLIGFQSLVLYLYRDEPSVGLVWFLVMPSVVASLGDRRDLWIWTPVSLAALVLAWAYVAQQPTMAHPLSLPNLVAAMLFTAIVAHGFLWDRDRRERALREALANAGRELELRAAAEREARAAERRTTRFLASVSHELRSPLTSMILSARMLRGRDGPADAEALDRIERSADVTRTLVNDLLDLGRIEAGKARGTVAPVPVLPLLDDIRTLLRPHAEGQGTVLRVLAHPDLTAVWRGDGACLRQVLLNLGSNAIKFTRDGEVLIVAEPEGEDLVFRVIDDGAGVAPEHHERIFDPYVQLTQAAQHGTGLGLTLAREFADLAGGTLELVRSAPGSGSEFCLRLPRSPRTPEDPDAGNGPRAGVDGGAGPGSGPETVGEGSGIVPAPGAGVCLRARSEEVRRWAERWARFWGVPLHAGGTPLDLDAPPVEDFAALRARLEPAPDADPGAEAPAVPGAVPAQPDADPSEAAAAPRCTALVCDDDPMIRDVLQQVLARLGHPCRAVGTGAEVLEVLRSGETGFLLLDLQLGDRSGIDVIRAVRALPGAAGAVPVCVISGSPEGRERALEAGAEAFLLKPPRIEDLARVARTLGALARERGLLGEA
jgi:signal transduction histidine kinase/ActR/RegA family two-component response regulator